MSLDIHFSSASDEWCTPAEVLDLVRQVGPIATDPCWNPNAITNPTRARYTRSDDGLSQKWLCAADEIVFVNPPYSDLATWLIACSLAGKTRNVIALVPSRTDTEAWHSCYPDLICFWNGRVEFSDWAQIGDEIMQLPTTTAPFPSAILLWSPSGIIHNRFHDAFYDHMVVAMTQRREQ